MKPVTNTRPAHGPARGQCSVTNTRPSPKKIKVPNPDELKLVTDILTSRFPIFQQPPVPMKVLVHEDVKQFLRAAIPAPDVMTRRHLKTCWVYFMHQWTRQAEYQTALAAGGLRHDLWRQPCGEVTDREQQSAIDAGLDAQKARQRPRKVCIVGMVRFP